MTSRRSPTATDLARGIIRHEIRGVVESHRGLHGVIYNDDLADAIHDAIIAALAAQGVTLAGPGQDNKDDVVGVITEALVWSDADITREQATIAAPTVHEWITEYWSFAALAGTTDDQPADRARPTEDEGE